MATLGRIKRRQEGVSKIRKVTKASEVVAATRLRRIETAALNTRPYTEGIGRIVASVTRKTRERHPFVTSPSKTGVIGAVIITSDRGLCGGFNANIFRTVEEFSRHREVKILVIGRRGRTYFRKKGFELIGEYFDLDEARFSGLSFEMTQKVIALYKKGTLSEIELVYNKFRLHLLGKVSRIRILPVEVQEDNGEACDYIYEPEPGEILNRLIPEYIEAEIRQAWFESRASEEMARMVAMKSATDNADELIEKLMLNYHKVRQAMITKEIIEVVSGAPG